MDSKWGEHLLFLGALIRHPRATGAVVPSSPFLARQMVREIERSSRVVELGPGTGAFTREILACAGSGGGLLAVETNRAFVERLRRVLPEVDCACAAAETLTELVAARGWTEVDHIVSGLPFASLPPETTRLILDGIQRVLRVGGTFTTFQYVHAFQMPPAVAFRRLASQGLGSQPSSHLVIRNVPPARVLTWRRRAH
jgi:phosphatidylethanolamine/phosphatidyl-N-methylethanolamine N-methyltransferase